MFNVPLILGIKSFLADSATETNFGRGAVLHTIMDGMRTFAP